MSLAAAQAAAGELRTALLDNGVRAVSIELQPGVAGSGWGVAPFKRGIGHHIASRPSQGLTPGLALVKRGRTGKSPLIGPLCNGYGGYDLTARIITLGWANHPGAGGPWSAPGWGTVPVNNGRPYIFGWEFEGGYEPYTDEMHDFMARCGAGTLDWLGTLPGNPGPAPLECWGEHKDPWAPGRKIDRIGYTAASGRARIAAARGTTQPGGFLMALNDQQQAELYNTVMQRLGGTPLPTAVWDDLIGGAVQDATGNPQGARHVLADVFTNARAAVALLSQLAGRPGVDVDELAAELLPALSELLRTIPTADVQAFARAAADEADRRARDGDPATGPAT